MKISSLRYAELVPKRGLKGIDRNSGNKEETRPVETPLSDRHSWRSVAI